MRTLRDLPVFVPASWTLPPDRLLGRGGAARPDARRVRRPVAAVPRVPGGVRLQLGRAHHDLRHLLVRVAGLAARRGGAVGPRGPTAGAGGRLPARGRRDGAVPVQRRRRLAARGPGGPGPGDRGPDQHAGRGTAGPAAPRAAPRRAHQQRLTGAGALAGRRGGRPAGAVRPVADRLGLRRPHRRVPAGLRRDPVPAAGDLAAAARRAGLAATSGARAARAPPGLRGRAAVPRGDLGTRRALRLARSVAPRGRLRDRQPPGRRPAHPRAQRHGRLRLAGAARRRAGEGAHPGLARLRRRRGRHRGGAVHRVGDLAVRRRGRHRFRLRRRVPRRRRDHHRRASRPGIARGCWPASSSSATSRSACPRSPPGSPSAAIGLERTAEIYGVAVIVLSLSAAAGLVLRRRRGATPLPTPDEVEALAA